MKSGWDAYKAKFIELYGVIQNKTSALYELKGDERDGQKAEIWIHTFRKCIDIANQRNDKTGEVIGTEMLEHFPEIRASFMSTLR